MSTAPDPVPLDLERLAACLSERLGQEVAVAGPPQLLTGGNLNLLWRVRLSRRDGRALDGAWGGELVVRRFQPDVPPAHHEREVAWHRFVWDAGYPTAEPLHLELDPAVLGAPFLVMTFLPGDQLMSWLDPPGPRAVRVPGVLAGAMLRLHRLEPPVAPPGPVLDATGVVAELRALLDRQPDDLVARAVDRLEGRLPTDTGPPVVCHLDLNPQNVLVRDGRAVGVVDWTNTALADRHLDLADLDAVVRCAPVDLTGPLARAASVGRRLLAAEMVRRYRRECPVDRVALTWFAAAAAARRRLRARLDAHAGPDGQPRGFTSPAYVAALGRHVEAALSRPGAP